MYYIDPQQCDCAKEKHLASMKQAPAMFMSTISLFLMKTLPLVSSCFDLLSIGVKTLYRHHPPIRFNSLWSYLVSNKLSRFIFGWVFSLLILDLAQPFYSFLLQMPE